MSVVTNHQLFSHTCLAQLQADPSRDEAAAPIAQGLRDWMPFRDTSSLHSLMDSWVGPVLDFLEFHHAPAGGAPHIRLLYAHRGDETPVGLCYVVPPGQDGSAGSPHSLDDMTRGWHPMAQTVLALRARDLRWGMLTDGSRWRLVDAQSLRRYEHYVEVDLDALARSDDPTPLRLFYTFFHCRAFSPSLSQGEGRGEGISSHSRGSVEVGLDRLVVASERATKAAEDHLKARVSHNEGIMAQLCLGLVQADGQDHYTEAERDAIYRDATFLLYRMLFLLYAEARGLLPVEDPAYRAVSLTALVQTARDYRLRGMPDPQATTLWERLKRLCTAIYESDPALGIPAYNGGLFDDADKPYLRDGTIADAYLTEALFDLACMPEKVPVDYRDLSVRHLGSLYEGMIEYRLQIAEETLWARRDGKGNLRFLRTGQDGAPRKTDEEIKPESVYFSQSPGERRATGTYYTPEYIVDYIVRQTVVRGLEERRAPLEEKLAGWLKETSEVWRMQRAADEELLRFVEEQVLTFRVCDPAMGSGHFLVNAAHQITDFIVETLHLAPWPNSDVDADPVSWRRRVVEHCLYGVDLSLMAVELAKLSLWLASVAEGKPLSFLDHHLRLGNSLIGARLEDLAAALVGMASTGPSRRERKSREAGQLSMLDHPAFRQHVTAATDLLAQISARVVERVEDIKAQEADYERVRAELEPYRRLANLWTARYFGVNVTEQQLQSISKYLANGAIGRVPAYEEATDRAENLFDKWRFFHWDLEFPIPMMLHSGFDVVIGNPPYDELSEDELGRPIEERDLFRNMPLYAPALTYRVNLYRLFMLRAIQLVKSGGLQGFIVPMSILSDRFALETRRHAIFATKALLIEAFPQKDDPNNRVFADAKLSTCLYILEKAKPEGSFYVRTHPGKHILGDSPRYWTTLEELLRFDPDNLSIPTIGQLGWSLALRLSSSPTLIPLGKIAKAVPGEIMINRSIKPYLSEIPNEYELVRGAYVGMYFLQPPKQGETLYLRRDKYLSDFGNSAKAKHHFHPRVIYQRYAAIDNYRRLIGAWLPAGHFCSHTVGYFVDPKYDPLCLLALFNSKVTEWRYAITSTNNSINGYEIEALPIPRFALATRTDVHHRLGQQLQTCYTTANSTTDLEPILAIITDCLITVNECGDVVHDLLAHLAQQMIDLHKERQRLEREADPFRFLPLDKALGGPLSAGEVVGDLSAVRHDIEGLRLSRMADGRWLLEVRAKLRDPESEWREYARDGEGNLVREWQPACRLPLDEPTGRFYHYAFAHLGGFEGAGKFPGGFTRTLLAKLKATKVPRFVPVDLAPLAALEAELAEVHRKIRLTDDLIDQIVYRLYGLTEEEIKIVEGQV